MTLPKGFKPKDTKKTKVDDSKSGRGSTSNSDRNQIKDSKATAGDLLTSQENKIIT
jgi:hypothetical protein